MKNVLEIFGIAPEDPGYIYLIQHKGKFKIGKSKNVKARMCAAKTWIPEMRIIGVKPFWNVGEIERDLHAGFAGCWYEGEWFKLVDEGYRQSLISNFTAFSDTDRDANSINFIYWFNGDGLSDFVRERHLQRLSLPKFLQQESQIRQPINRSVRKG